MQRTKIKIKNTLKAMPLAILLLGVLSPVVMATPTQAPEIAQQATRLINDMMNFVRGISTAGLVIGVGWGMFMRHFAGGDHQQVQRANSIMRGSVIAWTVFQGLGILTRSVQTYLGTPLM